jgi:2-polyprenyl-6-methoxyphenol hydroxylase-like FAD-dependent oxidoreductase
MASPYPQATPFLAGQKIIIAGAGLAGLSFAIALQKQWSASKTNPGPSPSPPTIVIYERDPAPRSTDREGYSLSIRSDPYSGGMQALRSLGLLEPVLRASLTGHNPPSGSGFAIWDKDWNELLKLKLKDSNPELPVPSMRIARKALRQILIDAISPNDVIHWDVACTSAAQLDNSGRVQVQLSNGDTDACDLLIAADGANSKIRAALRPLDALSFAGAVCITGEASFSDGIPATLTHDWGTVVGAGGVSLFAAPVTDERAVWSLSYLAASPRESVKPPLSLQQAKELRQEVLDRGRAIAAPFETLVYATDPAMVTVFNARDKQPFAHVGGDGECGRVVFIGDSNHAMSPFAGNGANMALMDGWDLAEELCSSASLVDALRKYDAKSMPRSKKAISMSHWSIDMAHAQGWRLALYVLLLRIMKLLFFRRN